MQLLIHALDTCPYQVFSSQAIAIDAFLWHSPINGRGHEDKVRAQESFDEWQGDGSRLVYTDELCLAKLDGIGGVDILETQTEGLKLTHCIEFILENMKLFCISQHWYGTGS